MNIDLEKDIVQSLSSLYPLQEFEEEAIDIVLNATPHWVPVTERLPEKFKNVLVTSRGGVSMAWHNGMYFEKGASTKHRAIQTVKAWMPLPEAYKGK